MRQENYAVTGVAKMCVAFKIANGGFHLFTISSILQRLVANILHFCIFQMRHLQVYAFPTMKQMYSLEIPVCSFLAKCPSTQVFSDAFIFLSLSILNPFTQLLFTSFIFQIVWNIMTFTLRSGDNLIVIFHDLSTTNGNQIIKKWWWQSFSWLRTASPIDFYHFSLN